MKIRYTLRMEKEVTDFDGIKDIDNRLDTIYEDIKENPNDYTDVDAKVIYVDDLEGEGYDFE